MSEEIPPLEDVPDVLKKLQERTDKVLKEALSSNSEGEGKEIKDSEKKISSSFGGMKKGFLFSGSSANSSTAVKKIPVTHKKTKDDIPHIKANPAKSDLVLKEVQEAMIDANKSNDFQNELAKRLEGNSDVMDVLADPNWIPILDEFQRDPQGAMHKYKNNSKVKKTLLKLCDVLGDTFLHMDKSKKTEEELLCGDLMENPQVKEALLDPLVMKITSYMKEGANDKVQRCLQTVNPEQKRHIQTLVDFGLFSFSM
ncbi:hypothetical protein SK128_009006 [Halocaridina rubra]|uniref:Uncharacterized protein n=1 Tax=Halocaridina rubra TaxID=373956 RepID=A0AAN8WRT4_HALRR